MINMECKEQDDGTICCTFNYYNSAHTLNPDCPGTHPNGWTIKAKVMEDYYEWVNYFEAKHTELGWVYGDFEEEVRASSYTALGNFLDNFQPNQWDYDDI